MLCFCIFKSKDNSRISFIDGSIFYLKVIKKILIQLGLYQMQEKKRGPPIPLAKCPERVVEPYDDGWPEYKEDFVEVQA